jgi:hypothetical protein
MIDKWKSLEEKDMTQYVHKDAATVMQRKAMVSL